MLDFNHGLLAIAGLPGMIELCNELLLQDPSLTL